MISNQIFRQSLALATEERKLNSVISIYLVENNFEKQFFCELLMIFTSKREYNRRNCVNILESGLYTSTCIFEDIEWLI